MIISRRTFLRAAGSALVVAVAAPLFIPGDRLAFGVPRRQISTATATPNQVKALWEQQTRHVEQRRQAVRERSFNHLPVLLVHEFTMQERGGQLQAGARVMVDQATSNRWLASGIAVPDRGHPMFGRALLPSEERADRAVVNAEPVTAAWRQQSSGLFVRGT